MDQSYLNYLSYTNPSTTKDFPLTGNITQLVTIPLCPDLLRYDYLGEADNIRGRVIRAFFWLMRVWPV